MEGDFMSRFRILFVLLLVLASQTAFALSGKVVDEDGKPIAGAVVKDLWSDAKTQSAKDGSFELKRTSVDPKPIVAVSKEGYAQFVGVQDPKDDNVNITLTNRTWIEGQVLDPNSKPIANALIRADSGQINQNGYVMTSVWTETHSDKDGHYKFFLAPGNYDVQVRVPKVGASRFNVHIKDGEQTPQDIQLDKGVTFVAHCVDSQTNKPLAGVRLWNWQHKGIEGTSDADGVVTIDGMQPGKFDFIVEKKGYVQWWSPQDMQQWNRQRNTGPSGRNFDELFFDLAPDMGPVDIFVEQAVTITGKVLDPDGKPVKGATVAPARTGSGNSITGDTRFSFTTKADGTFTMLLPSNLDRGDYNLVAHDGKYNQWRQWANGVGEPFTAKPGETIDHVTLKLTKPASAKGKVVDGAGNPAAHVEVRAMMTDGRDNRYYVPTTKTDKDGNYELKFIRPGEAMIQCEPFWLDPNQAPSGSTQTVDLKAGETNENVDLTSKK